MLHSMFQKTLNKWNCLKGLKFYIHNILLSHNNDLRKYEFQPLRYTIVLC